MTSASYTERRGQIEAYFDRTAVEAWSRLTSDAPVGRIRATVRAGRDRMRATILDWLPGDLRGKRVLDAGCGTGALAVELARRGAEVVAVDLSPTLVGLARERMTSDPAPGSVNFVVGDMLGATLGRFDHVVAMDSLIHYRSKDMVQAVIGLTQRTQRSVIFTFAPRTPALALMHAVGRCFPRGERAPAIEPVAAEAIHRALGPAATAGLWRSNRTERIASGFYTSQAMEMLPT
jgi:magnesium-protoporphyrin O-methyltransferase